MKDFFKFMFASMVGFILTSIILFFLFFAFIMAMVSFTQPKEVVVNETSILHLKLNYEITDRRTSSPMQFEFNANAFKTKPGLKEILKNIEKAKSDDRIKGIYLDMNNVSSGLATIYEIRTALADFKESGKFIYAYGDIYFQKAYYLATVADKIFLNPEGFIELKGFGGNVMFIKGLLEKLDIEAQVIRHGKYKSAIEPLILDKMSDENKEQTLAFVQSIWDEAVMDISGSRGLSADEINYLADNLFAQQPKSALGNKVVDSLLYYDQFLTLLADQIGVEVITKGHLLSPAQYDKVIVQGEQKKRSKNKIGVVYAAGDIVQGEGGQESIGGAKIARTIRSLRLDESIQAVVLRVNSPGGDGLASDIILREINLTREEKPVVVSMGNLAASGGYYIACGADKIFANPTTITGSIGVFGLIPNFQGFFNNKLGITFDGIKTNENADFIGVTSPLTDYQREIIQDEIDRFYTTFINHVSEGRNMTYEEVDAIAQGRVWSGKDAKELGLVDEMGGLNDAIAAAAELAELEDYRVFDYPEMKEPVDQLIEDFFGETKINILKNELGPNYKYFRYVEYISNASGVQMRLPYEISVE